MDDICIFFNTWFSAIIIDSTGICSKLMVGESRKRGSGIQMLPHDPVVALRYTVTPTIPIKSTTATLKSEAIRPSPYHQAHHYRPATDAAIIIITTAISIIKIPTRHPPTQQRHHYRRHAPRHTSIYPRVNIVITTINTVDYCNSSSLRICVTTFTAARW